MSLANRAELRALLNSVGCFPPPGEISAWTRAECREAIGWANRVLMRRAKVELWEGSTEPPGFLVPFGARAGESSADVRSRTVGTTRIEGQNKPRGST